MVRQIHLNFANSTLGGRPKSEPNHIASSLGFILADSYGGNKRLTSLAPVSIPFWIVQVSSTESIILAAISDKPASLESTENVALSSVKKSLGEVAEPRDIPSAVERALTYLGSVERKTQYIKHLENPEAIVHVANWFEETEPTSRPNRPESRIDSQEALTISQQFQQLRESIEKRVAECEELQKFANERIVSRVESLTESVKAERERWRRRSQTLEEIVNLESAELAEKKRDALSDIEMKYRMGLRALTAEFARESTSLEGFFIELLEKIRESRTAIGQKAEDIDGAIEEFDNLVNFLSEHVNEYTESIENIKAKVTQTLERVAALTRTSDEDKAKISESLDSQIREHQHRIVEFDLERTKNENELEEILDSATTSASTLERAIGQRLDELRGEERNLASFAFESEKIKDLAPLTLLDLDVFVATYETGEVKVFIPSILPSERFSLPLRQVPVDPSLDEHIRTMITDLSGSSSIFRNSLQKVCLEGNLLLAGGARNQVQSGLNQIQARQLLKEGVAERVTAQWDKYAGKCPKCGSEIPGASKSCPKCGTKVA
jgi:predicted DNA-binding ribbon-helix-helix protein